MSYELQTRQQTTLTPRLQQSVKLLQMSTLDFSKEVAEAIANNPFLDEQEEAPAQEDKAGGDYTRTKLEADGKEHERDSSIQDLPDDSSPQDSALPETQHLEP